LSRGGPVTAFLLSARINLKEDGDEDAGDGNGNSKSRLDRIEEMIERGKRANAERALANDAALELFEAENKRLLAAQILMNGAMQKMSGTIREDRGAIENLTVRVAEMAAGLITLELKMEETTGKLNALIDPVD
jgi:hypothetical protein